MAMNISKQIAALKRMAVTELRNNHIDVFSEAAGSGHKDYLVKRIAWRLHVQDAGDLTLFIYFTISGYFQLNNFKKIVK